MTVPLLYKTIMHPATLNYKSNALELRENLHELTNYAVCENDNIDKIHTYFDQNYTQLWICWQVVDNVHSILLNTYLTIPSTEFHKPMKKTHDDMIKVGKMQCIKFENLIQHTKAKYDSYVSISKGVTKSQEQGELIALMAQLKDMKDSALQLTHKLNGVSTKIKWKMKKDKERIKGQKKAKS